MNSKLIIQPAGTESVPERMLMNCGADNGRQRKKVYLHPGQMHVSSEPSLITTILGSCVGICLWDPVARVGGANHYILPKWPGDGTASMRYGDQAIPELLKQVLSDGARRERLQANVFGGASIFKGFQDSHGLRFGEQNVAIARTVLRAAGVQVVNEDVGGNRGRRVIFQTDTGGCWMKRL